MRAHAPLKPRRRTRPGVAGKIWIAKWHFKTAWRPIPAVGRTALATAAAARDCSPILGEDENAPATTAVLTGNARFAEPWPAAASLHHRRVPDLPSHDNVLSAARMDEFVGLPDPVRLRLSQTGCAAVGLCPVCRRDRVHPRPVFTRWFGLITAFNFVVAVYVAHERSRAKSWPAAI